MIKYITKSDIKRGLQCLKLAHQARFNPKDMAPMDPYQQLLIDRGNHVGKIAQKQVSEIRQGKLLFEEGNKFEDGLMKTKLALKDSRLNAYYEPTFLAQDLLVRCDILLSEKDGYDMIEVKSGSDLDEEYILDAAIQYYVLKQAGVKVNRTFVWMVNKECQLPDLTNLFVKEDISDKIDFHFAKIEEVINQLREVFKKPKAKPVAAIGDYCNKPFECPFKHICHQKENKIPELSVFNIPRISKRGWELFNSGIVKIDDIDLSTMKFTAAQTRMIECTQNNEMYLNKEAITKALSTWKFPLYLIDFEAMDYDLPGFENTRPGIHIAFQLSIKKLASPDAEIEHVAHHLHNDGSDPRKALGKFMLTHLGTEGSLVAYSQAYEKGKILDIAQEFSGTEKIELENLVSRLVDPLPIFRDAVYHPDFKGSYSIKKVGPALLGQDSSYEKLLVQDGTQAVVTFRKMISSQNPEEKITLFNALVEYCDKDTYVMGLLVKWLFQHQA